jgi:hypothetical protein
MFSYPPPRDYATPPAFPGQPWQIVPPAEGSLFQAWVSVGTRLTRQNIAAWSQACKRGWVAWSIAAYLTIALLPFLAVVIWGAIAGPSLIQNLFTSAGETISAADIQRLQNGFIIAAIVIAIVVPLLALASLYATTFFWALFMPATLGTVRERMRRAIKPYALILPATGLVTFLAFGLAAVVIALVASNIHFSGGSTAAENATVTQASSLLILGSLITNAFSIALGVYTYSLLLQAGSVGTTLSRLTVFGIDLLAGLVFGVVISVLFFIAIAVIDAIVRAQPGSSSMLMPLLHATMSRLR